MREDSESRYQELLRLHPQLDAEDAGIPARMENFYVPLFREFCRTRRIEPRDARVLDCGCGNGISVELLARAGFQAYGIDNWAVRPEQWRRREPVAGARLVVGDAGGLPFAGNSFDIVMSCGLLEHVGVHEEWEPGYQVRASEDQFAVRARFVSGCLRVLRRPGLLIIDHPNGAFPVDFWHDNRRFGGRWNSPGDGFLPTYREVRRLVRAAGFDGPVEAISPAGRFTYQQVGKRWWGRLLAAPFEGYFRLMETPGFRWLAGSPLNPYLVVKAEIEG